MPDAFFTINDTECVPSGFIDQFGTYLCAAVIVVEFGKFNFRELAKLPQEKIAELWKAWEQWTRVMEKDAALNNGQGIVLIVDGDGFSLAHYASSEGHPFTKYVKIM